MKAFNGSSTFSSVQELGLLQIYDTLSKLQSAEVVNFEAYIAEYAFVTL